MTKLIICPDRLHCAGLIAALDAAGIPFVQWDSRRLVAGEIKQETLTNYCARSIPATAEQKGMLE